MNGEGEQEEASDEETQESELESCEGSAFNFESNLHGAEGKRSKKNPDVFF